MPPRGTLTRERLLEVLEYNPDTGIFIWKISPSKKIRAGTIAGSVTVLGYVDIGIDYYSYFAHRLAFLYMEGRWPDPDPDHKNRIRHDNRWENLREASSSQNKMNRPYNNKTGYKGVKFIKRASKKPYSARIKIGDSRIFLGCFETAEEAFAAYSSAANKYFGEYAMLE
jgi:hypothetical protein